MPCHFDKTLISKNFRKKSRLSDGDMQIRVMIPGRFEGSSDGKTALSIQVYDVIRCAAKPFPAPVRCRVMSHRSAYNSAIVMRYITAINGLKKMTES